MGTPNIVTKEYMQDPQHFADAFNYYAFDGRQVVRAEKLSEEAILERLMKELDLTEEQALQYMK